MLLAVEVAASSTAYDRDLKGRIYARHGVRGLWVVDAACRETWVHREPAADGQWGSIGRIASDAPLAAAALPEIVVRMARLD